jgi:uncharacterized RmlC-like cupin family protein
MLDHRRLDWVQLAGSRPHTFDRDELAAEHRADQGQAAVDRQIGRAPVGARTHEGDRTRAALTLRAALFAADEAPRAQELAKGMVIMRLRFPANYDIPAHWHSMTERVTVLSGALNVGMGDRLDRQASQKLAPGGFVSLPAKMRHFAWTTSPTVVQINLEGPFDIFYVNPAEDPQAKTSHR